MLQSLQPLVAWPRLINLAYLMLQKVALLHVGKARQINDRLVQVTRITDSLGNDKTKLIMMMTNYD